ncbi:glutathione S-transferase family protein [Dichelobacter nodosus]|uniref:Glutathione S-transferase n=1 Tax=Dichelobacter nodosus (strain VCS1703A) TaxID=246195 RepID=A5EWT3_DICNV|nr:glutathione S-transferase N-terminal domain-containing protein [Dichelobacter nodosus]ABQ13805.1 Glutathione S-transferase [Dichelobacter nodosus VCS1703A]
MLKLYYLAGACSLVPHVALEWTKAPYEAEVMTHAKLKSPAYLALNPQGAVPLLQDGDWVLAQNSAILHYLDALYPQAHLFGSGDIKSQAKARQWLAFANTDVHKVFSMLFHPAAIAAEHDAQTEVRARATEKALSLLEPVNRVLSEQPYLTGELTIADVYFYVILRWARALKLDTAAFSALADFYQRVEDDAGVKNVLRQEGL